MKKNELLNLKRRLEALAMAGVMTVTFASCSSKKDKPETPDYQISEYNYKTIKSYIDKIKDTGIGFQKEASDEELYNDKYIKGKVYYSWYQADTSDLVTTYDFKYTIDRSVLADKTGSNVLLAPIVYDYSSSLQESTADGIKVKNGMHWIPNDIFFHRYKDLAVIPSEYSWIPKEELYNYLETDVISVVLKGTDDKYYICYDVRLIFNDGIKQVVKPDESYELPNPKDEISITSFDVIADDLSMSNGIVSTPIVKYQSGLKEDNTEIKEANIGDLNSIRTITSEELQNYAAVNSIKELEELHKENEELKDELDYIKHNMKRKIGHKLN